MRSLKSSGHEIERELALSQQYIAIRLTWNLGTAWISKIMVVQEWLL